MPLSATTAYVLTGFAFLLTPGKVGEAVRLWLLKTRQDVPYTRSLGLLLLDRMVDMACLMLLAGGGLIAANVEDGRLVAGLLVVLALPILVLASRRIVVSAVRLGYRATGRRWGAVFVFALATDRSVRDVCRPGLLIAAMGLGLAAWAAQIAGIWLVLGAFGYSGTLLDAAVLYPTALLLGAAAVMPGGADAVMLGMLSMAGMSAEVAVAATLVSRVLTWWLAMLVGFCVAPFVLAGVELRPSMPEIAAAN